MKNVTLPRYTIGPDALNDLERIVSAYGRKVALIHGAKAYAACQALLTPALGSLDVVREVCYGQEATYENVARLTEDPDVRRADVLVGIGGGKCLDTVKLAGDQLGKPVVTIATIASTCAAVTKISIMYNADGSFKDIPKLKAAPVHCRLRSLPKRRSSIYGPASAIRWRSMWNVRSLPATISWIMQANWAVRSARCALNR